MIDKIVILHHKGDINSDTYGLDISLRLLLFQARLTKLASIKRWVSLMANPSYRRSQS